MPNKQEKKDESFNIIDEMINPYFEQEKALDLLDVIIKGKDKYLAEMLKIKDLEYQEKLERIKKEIRELFKKGIISLDRFLEIINKEIK
jgi:hypothetical protein